MSERTYQLGAEFAEEVQQGLAEGKSFDDLDAFSPEAALHVRDLYAVSGDQETADLLTGYLSHWD